jgi:uncharacterized protein
MARRGLSSDTLTIAEARRIALHAQGFKGQNRDTKANWPKIAKAVDALHLLQIDSVNVLVRSHYLPLYARLGAYDMAALDKRSFDNNHRHFFECWAHEASLVPLTLHPLMRWRMARARDGDGQYKGMDSFGRENRSYLKSTLAFIQNNGPTRVRDIPGGGKSDGAWWGWSKGKLALETLFDQGLLTTTTRQGFERIYDIPERVIPENILALPTPEAGAAIHQLVAKSAEALGIATESDLRDYFRLPVADFKTALAENLEAGSLRAVSVQGWTKQAYLHRDATLPKTAGATALLSPFDPLVWNRDRAERLFNFHYRIELYTPEAKRKFGYYVLPFLHGDKIAGRLCLKADRESSTLKVNASHHETGVDTSSIAPALAMELKLLAKWLGLQNVAVSKSGNLAPALLRDTRFTSSEVR